MNNDIAFSLKGIEIIKQNLNPPEQPLTLEVFNFELQFRSAVNPPENTITLVADVKIADASSGICLGEYAAGFHFSIEALALHTSVHAPSGSVQLPEPLLRTLMGISASTLRGLMFATFKGTFLNHAVLPVIDVAKLPVDPAITLEK
jgi:hypothetical protein